MRCVIGLGNPGARYIDTAHNMGFLVLDRVLRGLRSSESVRSLVDLRRLEADIALAGTATGDILLVKPLTFMNASGRSVARILAEYDLGPGQMLVIHDDLDLPFGKLRFRARGSSGGHRGVESIIEATGTGEFSRLKIGIGREAGADAADYVLRPLPVELREDLEDTLRRASEAVRFWIDEGVQKSAERFN